MRASDGEFDTYTKVAKKAGVGRNTVKRLYLGSHGATLDTLEAVAVVFDASPWMLLVEDMKPSAMPILARPSAKEMALYDRIHHLEERVEALGPRESDLVEPVKRKRNPK